MTTRQVAKEWNRSLRTVQAWCRSGDILAFGFQCYRDTGGKWWLRVASTQRT